MRGSVRPPSSGSLRVHHVADRAIWHRSTPGACVAGFDDRRFYDLFEKKPASMWLTPVEKADLPNRTAPFDAWSVKRDRVDC
ncbi:cytosine deaminase [Streptomyces pristinaespiralis]|uniref:Cytosine deaminase n=1 Tax=Streptomyces pristinaespiralis TaxID=38300 RepID=A0A0M4D6W5_STRPR|nr:cytosine deaminase [Streptomyces pristinaespiralis]